MRQETGVAGVQELQELQNKSVPGGCFYGTRCFQRRQEFSQNGTVTWVMN
jgi:hypothetical protein